MERGFENLSRSVVHERGGERPVKVTLTVTWADGCARSVEIPASQYFGDGGLSPMDGGAIVSTIERTWRAGKPVA